MYALTLTFLGAMVIRERRRTRTLRRIQNTWDYAQSGFGGNDSRES